METRWGISPCCVIIVTFLTLSVLTRSSQGQQQLELISEPDARYYVMKKQEANITCEAYSANRVVFTCAGLQIPASSQKTYESYDEERATTFIRSTIQVTRSDIINSDEDKFECSCSVYNDDTGEVLTSRSGLVVLSYLKKTFAEEPYGEQTVTPGTLTVFTCIPPKGDPTPEVIWRKDGQRITPERDDNFVVGADGSLTIVSPRDIDSGEYACVARNEAARRISTAVTLIVTDDAEGESNVEQGAAADAADVVQTTAASEDTAKPRSERAEGVPRFLETPQQGVFVTPTEPVSIVCDVRGAQLLTMRCNGLRVDSEQLDMKQDRQAQHIRAVYNVTFAVVENFINTIREEEYKCECVAWYQDPKSAERRWASKQSVPPGSIQLAYLNEDFVAQPQDVAAQVRTQATLKCSAPEGKPKPWVYWVFEQQRLDPRVDARLQVGDDGSLTIRNLDYRDGGRYYCVAENSVGIRQSGVATLSVSEDPVVVTTVAPVTSAASEDDDFEATFPSVIPEEPVFTRDLQDTYYLNADGEAKLVCSVVSAQILTYRCNNVRLDKDRQSIDEQVDRASGKTLIAASVTINYQDVINSQMDEFFCQCTAWYMAGGSWNYLVSKQAFIKEPFIDQVFEYNPRGKFSDVGETAEFACSPPKSAPEPVVFWMKGEVEVDPELDRNFEVLEDNTLIIDTVRVEDAGEYTCVAVNAAGSRSSQPALLELSSVPDPTRRPSATARPVGGGGGGGEQDTTTPYYDYYDSTTMFDINDVGPMFVMQPEAEMFIIKNRDAELSCQAIQATLLTFFCNNQKMPKEREHNAFKTLDPQFGYAKLEMSLLVNREEVEERMDQGLNFTCECRAYFQVQDSESGWDYIATEPSLIQVAYIRKNFKQEPVSQVAELGVSTELVCRPPAGIPTPTVHWVKDGFKLNEGNQNLRVTEEGSLVIEQVTDSDAGNYTCVAENVVNTRNSRVVPLTVVAPGAGPSQPEAEGGEGEVEGEGEAEGEVEGEGEAEVEGEAEGEAESEGEAEGEGEGESEGEWGEGGEGGSYPTFQSEPEPLYYIIKSRPVTITCQARGAERITFSCNAENVPESMVQYEEVEGGDQNALKASIDVSRAEVEKFNRMQGGNDFYCQCYARYTIPDMADDQFLTSSKGYVQVAYLKKIFKINPENSTVDEGKFLSLACSPPEGHPAPEVYWQFNKERVYSEVPTPNHALVFSAARAENAGLYECVAKNMVNTRHSQAAYVTVNVGGTMVTGDFVDTGTPEPEGEHTSDYVDVSTLPGQTAEQKCMTMIQECGTSMPQPNQPPSPKKCMLVNEYVRCLDDFITQCRGQIGEESMKAAEMALSRGQKDKQACSSPGPVCEDLLECQNKYTNQQVQDDNNVPVKVLCQGIEEFLRCAEEAAIQCNIPEDSPDTSLGQLADWFASYCEKIDEGGWAESCPSLSECKPPIEQTTIVANLVQATLWCPYVNSMMECTTDKVNSCGMPGVEQDIQQLANLAMDTCPAHLLNPDAEGEAEGEGVNEGSSTDEENSATTAQTSILLISLLPVAFVWLINR